MAAGIAGRLQMEVERMHQAQKVWLSNKDKGRFYGGDRVVCNKDCPGDRKDFTHIIVMGHEILEDLGTAFIIEKKGG